MAEERDDEQTNETQGASGQQPTGQQGQPSEFGQQQGQQGGDFASQPTMTGGQDSSTQGSQGNFGGQSSSGQAQGGGAGSDIMTNDEGASGGTGTTGLDSDDGNIMTGDGSSGESGEGFVGSQGSGSDEYLREEESSSETLDRSDFANQGQGATESSNENVETGQRQDSDTDIEGSSDNS